MRALATDLAAAWDESRCPLIAPLDAFVETVRKHDDGWIAWEVRPEVHDGVPRDFMEMPLDESLAIWRRSIAVAQTISTAASVIVGGHFRFLLNKGLAKHEVRHDWPPEMEHLAEEFIEEQDSLRAEYFAACSPELRKQAAATVDRGLRFLQLFDFASLWFCCAERTKPETMTGPDERSYVFTPGATAADSGSAAEVTVEPWPFRGESLGLSAVGRRVPAASYPSADALAAAPATEIELRWRLVPAGS